MPELPEVETVRRSLSAMIVGHTVTAVTVRRAGQVWRPADPEAFATALTGQSILAIDRRGKQLIVHWSGGYDMVVHLRMTGKLLVRAGAATPDKHDHILWQLDDGRTLVYNDVRTFGGCALWQENPYDHPPLSELGIEPLDTAFDGPWLYDATRGHRATIKGFLLDQHRIAGIGNIYADEALFRAGIRPRKAAGRLTRKESEALATAVRQVLQEAIAAGGSSIRDYVDAHGESGHFQDAHFVYGRGGRPCKVCGTTLKKITVAGRTTVYCPHCQKA